MIANFFDSIMGSAHERFDAFVIGRIKRLEYFLDVLKLQGLSARFFLGHMIYAEKLIISKKQIWHHF